MSEKKLAEQHRLKQDSKRVENWKRWGPYLSERQWGTVREDYSDGGNSWSYFPHDHARSRAYRWGEDGLLGITDRQCRLCFFGCAVERKRPDLKRKTIWPGRPGRQPWRRCQRMLLLSGQFANAFLHAGTL